MTDDEAILERVTFFDGQRLAAADLESVHDGDLRLRRLHNRTLHDWGVASGLGVSGKKGDREVRVAPGHALNRFGRELIVSPERVSPVPAVAGSSGEEALYELALAPAESEPVEVRQGVCAPAGAVRVSEAPRISWRLPEDRRADEVVLAQVWIRDCRLSRPPSPEGRRDALSGPRPRIASGATPQHHTRWRFWPDPDDASTAVGVSAAVDTANGGFRLVPHYQAELMGARLFERDGQEFVVDGHAEVHAPAAAGFCLRVTLPRNLSAGGLPVNPDWAFVPGFTDRLAGLGAWHVTWLGVEP